MSENESKRNETLVEKEDFHNDLSIEETFTNDVIDQHSITIESVRFTSLSPKYRLMNLIWSASIGLIIALLLFIASTQIFFSLPEDLSSFIPVCYVVLALLTLWSLIYHYFADPLKMYALREHDLNYQSGWIFRSLVSQPILRIQHIEIKRGPIERKAGLATLQVFSAGGASHTFNIPGLEYENAIRLRQFILNHKDLAKDV